MRKVALSTAAAMLMLATPALAQGVDFSIGPRGPSVHVGPGYGYHGPRGYYREGYVRHREYPGLRRSYRVYDYD